LVDIGKRPATGQEKPGVINIYEFSTIRLVFSDVPDEYYYRTVKVGQTVKFPCPTKLREDVDWVRVVTPPMTGQRYIYLGNLGMRYDWRDRRFTKLDRNHSHTLVISNVTLNDSAYYYRCVEDSGLGRRRFYHLTVEGTDMISSIRKNTPFPQSCYILLA